MVRFFVATFLLPFMWRCVVVEAQSVLSADGDLKPSMVRSQKHREARGHSALQLDASGEIVRMEKSDDTSSQTPASAAAAAPAAAATCIMSAFPMFGDSTCGEAFVQGTENTNDCTDAVKHSVILQQSLCDMARREAGVTTVTTVVPFNETKLCPIGCSKRGDEFLYNPSGDCPMTPATLGGTPVCRKYRYQNSTTKDANEDCPESYERIITKAECLAAASCQGFCTSDEWFVLGQRDPAGFVVDDKRPAWADSYNSFPTGCFIRDEDGCAYFNDPMTGTEHARTVAPTEPKGLGLCKVTARYL